MDWNGILDNKVMLWRKVGISLILKSFDFHQRSSGLNTMNKISGFPNALTIRHNGVPVTGPLDKFKVFSP
ncbi:hypothetical protein K8T06_02605 [bacterium]|nr:hypothetical protein [bacterium]